MLPIPQSRILPDSHQHKLVQLYSHVPAGTVFHSSNGSGTTAVASGFQAFDTATITCKHVSGCTVQVLTMIEAGESAAAGNKWGSAAQVDGNYITDPYPPYIGELPVGTGAFASSMTSFYVTVAQGDHTFSNQIYTDGGATLGVWQTTYNVFVP